MKTGKKFGQKISFEKCAFQGRFIYLFILLFRVETRCVFSVSLLVYKIVDFVMENVMKKFSPMLNTESKEM